MPKVTNETDRAIKVIIAYRIEIYMSRMGGYWQFEAGWFDIYDAFERFHDHFGCLQQPQYHWGTFPIRLSDDQVTWVLEPGETRYVECDHTNDIIFTTHLNEGLEVGTSQKWIVGEISPPEHIHLWYVEPGWGYEELSHWSMRTNEGGGVYHLFYQPGY